MAVSPSTFWNSISLRTKITGVTVLMLTFGLIIAGIGTMTVLRSYLLNQVDSQLRGAYTDISPFLGSGASALLFKLDDVESAPKEYYVALIGPNGSVTVNNWGSQPASEEPSVTGLPTTPSLDAQAQSPVFILSSTGGKTEWHAAVRTVGLQDGSYGTLVIASSLEKTDSVTTTYLSIFLAFGVGVVVLGAMLTRLLVSSTFTPLRAVEKTAAEIANGDFSQRMAGDTPNTEVGRLNRSLNTMLSRIDTAFTDRAKTIDQMRRFVGDASHELRTPLVSVRGYAELYRMGALQTPEEVAKAMDRIEKEAIRMGALVEDLLELARLDETRPMNLERIDLVPIAVDAALDARASSPERVVSIILPRSSQPVSFVPAVDSATNPPVGMTGDAAVAGQNPLSGADEKASNLTGPIGFAGATLARLRRRPRTGVVAPVDPRTGAPVELVPADVALSSIDSEDRGGVAPIVMADENKIRQVVANLIGNALRFTPSDSPIEVSIQVDEARRVAILDVIDHGEGIPPQIREKIFQRFWRADSSRTRETGGSGLGLAIVSSIIAAHHGTVEAVETTGGGATFRVTLPLAPIVASSAPGTAPATA
ncbi:HAMP domain-containing histidine kinase [Subtercola sp. PAMC28395]|uniref:HAMP domain-containing sensor histidine kinase n=1 Tax=Subtercola sp. PAMC28395 TaxID=2846775 RepID=UPI001C0D12A1|nr:HAMP domain-containing sensor histidine kinase [Subtercola sp. PAMC28395]QWT23915.1 HAMP domain-containing histidine kinase [Subtercola sp. PAMC28395]